MIKDKYTQVIESIKAPQGAIDRALDAVYDDSPVLTEIKPVRRARKSFVSAAAVIAVVALAGAAVYGFGHETKNSFSITANAAEISSVDEVKIGELKGSNNAMRMCFDKPDEVYYIAQCKTVAFPIICSGVNIDKITYTVNGNGYLAVDKNASWASDMEYVPEIPDNYYEAEKYPYDIADTENYSLKVKSFSTDYDNQSEVTALLGLYTEDDNDEYCREFSSQVYYDKQKKTYIQGYEFDYEDMYYNLFKKNSYSVDITVTFNDSSTQTKTLSLGIERKDSYEPDDGYPFVITAKFTEDD